MFPGKSEEEAIHLLWEEIFKATRVNEDNPVQAWINHDQNLHEKVDHLNERHYAALHYQAEGTDLTIKLPRKHVWAGAGSVNENGHEFMANMPTEEVFTLPQKTGLTEWYQAQNH